MSFFDDSSLAFLPSGAAGKDGKAYSIKPTDGTGDFTFSRGSNLAATRVGPTGLIEKGRENLLTYSNDFSNAIWSKSNTSVTSGQTGYDGSSDAWKLTTNTANSTHYTREVVTTSGVTTASVYAKADGYNFLFIFRQGLNKGYYYNLSTGELASPYSQGDIDATITSEGNGWYRCTFTFNHSGTGDLTFFIANADGSFVFTGDGTSGILIQDAQLEIGLAATEVIESGAITGKAGLLEDEPRFDYSGGATCPSLLLEPSRTNTLGQSEYFNGYYAKFASGITYDINTSETTSPEGLYNATKLISSTNNEQQAIYKNITTATPTFTCYAKAAEFDTFALKLGGAVSCNFTLTGSGSIGYNVGTSAKSIESVGNGWYRCSISSTSNSVYAWIAISSGNTQGDGTSGIYIWGAQAEAGSYPTSYIPNHSGGTITRGADDATLLNINTNIVDITGDFTFFVDNTGSLMKGNELYYYFIELYWDPVTSIRYYSTSNGSWYFKPDNSYTGFSNSVGRQIIKYENGVFYHFLNGSKSTDTRTMATTNSLSRIEFLTNTQGKAGYLDVKQALLFDTALSDADCITLTT